MGIIKSIHANGFRTKKSQQPFRLHFIVRHHLHSSWSWVAPGSPRRAHYFLKVRVLFSHLMMSLHFPHREWSAAQLIAKGRRRGVRSAKWHTSLTSPFTHFVTSSQNYSHQVAIMKWAGARVPRECENAHAVSTQPQTSQAKLAPSLAIVGSNFELKI